MSNGKGKMENETGVSKIIDSGTEKKCLFSM
jgi:hypothetical protein